jgi:hypothetical protein
VLFFAGLFLVLVLFLVLELGLALFFFLLELEGLAFDLLVFFLAGITKNK